MTTAKFQTETKYGSPLNNIKINGREYTVSRITEITKLADGYTFTGLANGSPFEIYGGKKSGGAANEWFVEWPAAFSSYIRATSLVDAVKLIEGA